MKSQDYYGFGFRNIKMTNAISKCEELLDRVRKDKNTNHLYNDNEVEVQLSAAELNRLVSGVKRRVYQELAEIEELLEFGQIPASAIETTFAFVDTQLLALIPSAAERLIVAYRNLSEQSKENWANVADTCRRVIKDFADVVFPPQSEPAYDLVVTEEKYLNRIRAFIKQTVESDKQRRQLEAVLTYLGEMLARTDNLASRSVHSGDLSRFEAERILIYTYLAIGDILVLSGYRTRPDTSTTRVNLNQASHEDLQIQLGLTAAIASEIVKYRKHRNFASWADVAGLPGIGPRTLEKLQKLASL